MNDDAVDYDFIGPPCGWFGRTELILGHVSLLNRFVGETSYSEGLTRITGIGPRFA